MNRSVTRRNRALESAALFLGGICVACEPHLAPQLTHVSASVPSIPPGTDLPLAQPMPTETPAMVAASTESVASLQLTYFVEREAGALSHVIYAVDIGCLDEATPCLSAQRVVFQTDLKLNSYDWSPDGRLLAFSAQVDGKGDIFVADLATEKVSNITQTKSPAGETEPAWSPSGEYLAYELCDGECRMVYSRPDGSERKEIVLPSHGGEPLSPRLFSWSPSGDALGFLGTRRDGFEQIWTLDLRENTLSQLTDEAAVLLSPAYIEEGSEIAYVRYTNPESGSPSGIFSRNLATGFETTLVPRGNGNKFSLAWNEARQWLVYTAAPENQQYDLHLWSASAGKVVQLTDTSELSELGPKWRTVH